MPMGGEKKKRRKSLSMCPAGRHATLTWPAGQRAEEVFLFFLQLEGPRGDTLIRNVSVSTALTI